MCTGSEAGLYLRLKDTVSLNSRLESNKEEAEDTKKQYTTATRQCCSWYEPGGTSACPGSKTARLILYEKSFNLKLSGNEVYYTKTLIFLKNMMLCSKLHCQKVFN